MGRFGQRVMAGPFVRHGIAEQSSVRGRVRSRDRGTDAAVSVSSRGPAGTMERTEWIDALQAVAERVKTLERVQHGQAQAIGCANTRSDQHQSEIMVMKYVIECQDVNNRKFLDDVLYKEENSVDKKLKRVEGML